MSAKHTPGPWVYALEYGPYITEPPRITTVAHCANYVIGLPSEYPGGNYRDGDPSGDEESDARLIAAAPEMLDALRVAEESVGDLKALEIVRAAIAKATGDQS